MIDHQYFLNNMAGSVLPTNYRPWQASFTASIPGVYFIRKIAKVIFNMVFYIINTFIFLISYMFFDILPRLTDLLGYLTEYQLYECLLREILLY